MSKVPSPPNGLTDEAPFPPDCAHRFVYTRKLGAGGFGSVFQAHDRNRGAPAAVKLLFADLLKDTAQVRRFCDEARITGSLSHPHVVRVLDFGAEFGVPWIAFEYIRGQNVRAKLDAGGVTLLDALKIVSQVGQALAAAHAQGILHRDVKPDNVLETENGEYKITDFGIAKWSGTRAVKTATGMILGTAQYVAPELVHGNEPSPAADIYALGVMLYELLAGQPPYADPNLGRLLERHLRDPIPQVSAARPGLPEALDVIVASALAKKPEERYRSMAELVAAVDEVRVRLGASPPGGLAAPAPPASLRGSGTRMLRPSGRVATRAASRPVLVPPGAVPPATSRRRVPMLAAVVCALALAGGYQMLAPRPPVASPSATPTPAPRAPEAPADLAQEAAELIQVSGEIQKLASRKLGYGLEQPMERGPVEPDLAEMGRLIERAHAILQPLLAKHGKDPQLLMFIGPLEVVVWNANHLVQLLSPLDALPGDRAGQPHPVATALAKLQAALGVPGAGDYVYPLRCSADGLLAITARTVWGRTRFFTDSDVLRATTLTEQAIARIPLRHQREDGVYELLARIACLNRTATILDDMGTADGKAKARTMFRAIYQRSAELAKQEQALPAASRRPYAVWLDTRMGEHALVAQFRAATFEAIDTVVPQADRLRALDSCLALVDARGLLPSFTWVTAALPQYADAIRKLTGVRDLPLTPAQSTRLAALAEILEICGSYSGVMELPDDTENHRGSALLAIAKPLKAIEKYALPGTMPAKMQADMRKMEAAWRAGRRAPRE